MRPSASVYLNEADIFEQRALAVRFEHRIETALEVQFRRVENILQTMDALTRPRGGRR